MLMIRKDNVNFYITSNHIIEVQWLKVTTKLTIMIIKQW